MRDPLREPTFLILAALAPQPLHGYAIIGEVAELSGGRLALRPGTLYGALDRLADEGLLESDHEDVVDGRLRRYYRLTDDGAAVLDHEAARLQRNAEAARGRLARRPARHAGPAGPALPGPVLPGPALPGPALPGPVLPGVGPRPAGGLA